MATALISPPAAKPITLEEVKRHLRVEIAHDDEYIDSLINVAVNHLEVVCGIKLISQTWRQYLDRLPGSGCIRLAVNPVQSIEEVRYFNKDGMPHIIANHDLALDAVSSPARLLMKTSVPTEQIFNGIEIDIVAGFGDTGIDVPDSLKRALLLFIAHNYEFRGALAVNEQPASEPHGFRTLITPFRNFKL